MRRDADEVAPSLAHRGFSALALHGDMEQRDRDEVLVRFGNRSCTVLVATDVAARGLDIDELAPVVNYELPTDPDVYVHRIGRTGRAGRSGLALSLCAPREVPRARPHRNRNRRAVPLAHAAPRPPQRRRRAPAPMETLRIDAGRSDKLRPGDIARRADRRCRAGRGHGRQDRRVRDPQPTSPSRADKPTRRWRGCRQGGSRDAISG